MTTFDSRARELFEIIREAPPSDGWLVEELADENKIYVWCLVPRSDNEKVSEHLHEMKLRTEYASLTCVGEFVSRASEVGFVLIFDVRGGNDASRINDAREELEQICEFLLD